MAKPTGADCNLRCDYCYFLPKKKLSPKTERMSDKILEEYVKQLIESHNVPSVTVAWQGGEPTLMGLEFYKRATKLVEKYKKSGTHIEHTIQTNGTLLDDEWCAFFRENNYLVGISLDGPPEFHDTFRKNKVGDSVYDQVMKGIALLQKHTVEFNVLTTVNAANVKHPLKLYSFLRDDLKIKFIHFIPVVETGKDRQNVKEFSLKPGEYGDFLNSIFDEWIQKDVGEVFVQMFDTALASWAGAPQTACVFAPTCGTALIMMPDGAVYSCDHFADSNHCLGTISKTHLSELVSSEKQRLFGESKQTTLPEECKECAYLFACQGGCPKNRFVHTKNNSESKNYLCSDYKAFFEHIDTPMQKMTSLLRQGRAPAEIMENIHTNK